MHPILYLDLGCSTLLINVYAFEVPCLYSLLLYLFCCYVAFTILTGK